MIEACATGSPVELRNPEGSGAWLVVCEHASSFMPAEFDNLGLDVEARQSHAAWDPGALAVAEHLSALLDAPLAAACVSRLLYDCNRPPDAPSSVPEKSEIYRIPGNEGLSQQARHERAERFYFPFRDALAAAIEAHAARVGPPAIVTVHSFTRVYNGVERDVEIGVLHDIDARLADAMMALADEHRELAVRRNEPYGPQDGVTHTLREHALPRGLANVMLEIRNDLIADAASQKAMAARLAGWLRAALPRIGDAPESREAASWAAR